MQPAAIDLGLLQDVGLTDTVSGVGVAKFEVNSFLKDSRQPYLGEGRVTASDRKVHHEQVGPRSRAVGHSHL